MPYHGTIKSTQHSNQLWILTVEMPPAPDYTLTFDNETFSIFYSRITGCPLSDHLLRYGDWFVQRCLDRVKIQTSPRPLTPPNVRPKAGDGGVEQ